MAFAQKAVADRDLLKHVDSALGLRTFYWWAGRVLSSKPLRRTGATTVKLAVGTNDEQFRARIAKAL